MNTQSVVAAFATKDEAGKVVAFDFAEFDKLVSELVTERAKIRKENKEAIKNEKEAMREALSEPAKKFYDGLAVGEEFDYKTADGTIVHAKKIETKSGAGKSAACEVISGIEIADGKSPKRYPKFYQLVVPTNN